MLPGPDSSGISIVSDVLQGAFNYGPPRSAERAPRERTGPTSTQTLLLPRLTQYQDTTLFSYTIPFPPLKKEIKDVVTKCTGVHVW